jgi:hypothetical protein
VSPLGWRGDPLRAYNDALDDVVDSLQFSRGSRSSEHMSRAAAQLARIAEFLGLERPPPGMCWCQPRFHGPWQQSDMRLRTR